MLISTLLHTHVLFSNAQPTRRRMPRRHYVQTSPLSMTTSSLTSSGSLSMASACFLCASNCITPCSSSYLEQAFKRSCPGCVRTMQALSQALCIVTAGYAGRAGPFGQHHHAHLQGRRGTPCLDMLASAIDGNAPPDGRRRHLVTL